jgi:hypothetical protein
MREEVVWRGSKLIDVRQTGTPLKAKEEGPQNMDPRDGWQAVKNHGSDIEMGFPAEKGPVKIQRWQHQIDAVPKVKPRPLLRIRIIMGLFGLDDDCRLGSLNCGMG